MARDNETTPGPWYVVKTGQQFTAIATVPELAGEFDPDHEVLTVSHEWLNVRLADIYLMAKAPELKAEIEALREVVRLYVNPNHVQEEHKAIVTAIMREG